MSFAAFTQKQIQELDMSPYRELERQYKHTLLRMFELFKEGLRREATLKAEVCRLKAELRHAND